MVESEKLYVLCWLMILVELIGIIYTKIEFLAGILILTFGFLGYSVATYYMDKKYWNRVLGISTFSSQKEKEE